MSNELRTNRRRPGICIELHDDEVTMLGLPGTAKYVVASYALGYGFCATLANVRGFGAVGKDFLLDVFESVVEENKYVVIRTVQGVVVYENRSGS